MECADELIKLADMSTHEVKYYMVPIKLNQDYDILHSQNDCDSEEKSNFENDKDEDNKSDLSSNHINQQLELNRNNTNLTEYDENTTDEYIMTYEFGDLTKPTLVIVHGYLGFAMEYFKTFKYLENDFHVLLIDNIGFGASSRPKFLGNNYKDVLEYFIQAFENWRKKMNITDFYLAGHSMGAYIVAKYTLRYSKHVKKLLLWSPLGVEPTPENPKQFFYNNTKVWSIFKPIVWLAFSSSAKWHFNHVNIFRVGGRV